MRNMIKRFIERINRRAFGSNVLKCMTEQIRANPAFPDLTIHERARLVRCLDQNIGDLIAYAYDTGMRDPELAAWHIQQKLFAELAADDEIAINKARLDPV